MEGKEIIWTVKLKTHCSILSNGLATRFQARDFFIYIALFEGRSELSTKKNHQISRSEKVVLSV